MHILADRDFTTFTGTFNAKDHYRYLLSYLRTFADATRGNNDFARKPSQAHQNQIGMSSPGALYRVSFVSGDCHAIAVCLQQLLNAVAGFRDIFHYEDGQLCVIFSSH
jgi:hypothetical protein